MLHQLGRRRRDRKSQDGSVAGEQNNVRAECACLPRASGLTRRNVLVRAKSEEQTTVQRRQLVRAASEDHHARCPAPPTRPPSPPPPRPKNLLTRAKSEEQQSAARCHLLRTNSDGRRYKVSNLLRQEAVTAAAVQEAHRPALA